MTQNPLTDEKLAYLASNGDTSAQDALLSRYKNFVKMAVRPYFIMGADREDLVQEGMIGLYKAIREYRPDRDATFASFAGKCIKNQILTAIKNASRKKHSPLNSSISIHQHNPETLQIIDENQATHPEKALLNQETKRNMETLVTATLSPLESAILTHFLSGASYAEIAATLDKSTKSVDNALTRIRRKVAKLVADE